MGVPAEAKGHGWVEIPGRPAREPQLLCYTNQESRQAWTTA